MIEKDLTDAVREMRDATLALRTLIQKEYPTRRELESRYVQKTEQKRRIYLALATMLAAVVGSFFGTVATVSGCFLGSSPGDKPSAACSLMPGYDETREQNEAIIKEFQRLQKITRENQSRIDRLEREK